MLSVFVCACGGGCDACTAALRGILGVTIESTWHIMRYNCKGAFARPGPAGGTQL
jgi:hypothetical protein